PFCLGAAMACATDLNDAPHPRAGDLPMTRFVKPAIIALAALSLSVLAPMTAASAQGSAAQSAAKPVTTASGLQIIDTKIGTGVSPRTGQTCIMHYTGWLMQNGVKGQKFDSSVDRGQPFE